jgi:hypothetical protein
MVLWVVVVPYSLMVGINVLETLQPPSTGLKFVIKEMSSLHCCLSTEVPDG